MFEPRRIVIVFETVDTVREAKGGGNAHLVFRLVFTVAALALGLPELRHGQRLLTCNFVYIIQNAVGIAVIRLDEFAAFLIAERERHARVDDSLPLERVLKIFLRNVDVGEDGQIGLPAEDGAGGLAVGRLLFILPTSSPFSKCSVYLNPSRRTVASKYSDEYCVAQEPRPFRPSENS